MKIRVLSVFALGVATSGQRGTFEFPGEVGVAAGTWGAAASPSFNTEVALFRELRAGLLVEASVATRHYEYAPIEAPR